MGFANNDLIQSAIEAQIANEENNEEEYLDFNPLQLYFGDDYVVNDKITIHQPSIQDYITYGEENIQSVIYPFISNTTKCRLQLWNNGIDWNDITNQQLFSILIKSIDLEYSKLMFGDIDFHGFSFFTEEKDGKESVILYNPIQDIKIDEPTRIKMCKYIQYMFHTFPPEEEFTSSKTLKRDLINRDKQNLLAMKRDSSLKPPSLLSMISFYLNHPGSKYKKNELRNVGIVEFYDSVQRLQIYESTHAVINGSYSGFVDTSKIPKNEFNFMRDLKGSA